MTEGLAAQRGIVDRASGAATAEAARKRMTNRAFVKLGPTPTFDDMTLTMSDVPHFSIAFWPPTSAVVG